MSEQNAAATDAASTTTTTPRVRCVGVTKSYQLAGRAVSALRGLDLTIQDPGFYAIMGRSGSGKSTLLHLLAALDRPDTGTVNIAGTDVGAMTEAQATRFRRESIGIVFQQFNLIPTMTARENVELPGTLAGREPSWLRDRSDVLLAQLGMAERATHRPEALSGGEQQRIAIARALLFEPPVVLADEPTGSLDSASSERLWSVLDGVANEHGTTVIMVTHEPAAAAHCSRAYIIQDGRVTGSIETEGLDASGVAARYQQHLGT